MSRCTQYIGLNDYAKNYIKDALSVETYNMTKGMFDEIIKGNIYHMPVPDGTNKDLILTEVIQDSPWASGPMIFTCLEAMLIKENGQRINMGIYFWWMIDPNVKDQEYDTTTGRYYV
jgi:hypothetical protein